MFQGFCEKIAFMKVGLYDRHTLMDDIEYAYSSGTITASEYCELVERFLACED